MRKFEFIKTLLLSIITCGIYGLYAWYATTEDHNTVASRHGEATITGFIVALLLGIITCSIYMWYWYYKYYSQAIAIAKAKNMSLPFDNAIVMTILSIIPIYSWYLFCQVNDVVIAGE